MKQINSSTTLDDLYSINKEVIDTTEQLEETNDLLDILEDNLNLLEGRIGSNCFKSSRVKQQMQRIISKL